MKTRLGIIFGLLLAASLLVSGIALAQGGYQLIASVVAGGGGSSQNGSYGLAGTIGQPGIGTSSGGTYTLAGGFWPGAEGVVPITYYIYLPLVIR